MESECEDPDVRSGGPSVGDSVLESGSVSGIEGRDPGSLRWASLAASEERRFRRQSVGRLL